MKKLLLALSLFISTGVVAAPQKDTVVNITDAGEIALPAIKGWKFHAGDNAQFARSDYDDHNWQRIDPTLIRGKLPRAARTGLGWLRLHFHIADSLHGKLFLSVFQHVAADIYLNGKLIARRGTIDVKKGSGRGYLNYYPVALPFTKGPMQVLAVRYGHQAVLRYFNSANLGPFCSISFVDIQQTINSDKVLSTYSMLLSICMSALILLALLHLVFLYFNRSKKANLYFAGYVIFNALFCFFLSYTLNYPMYVLPNMVFNVLQVTMAMAGSLCGLRALYSLYDFKPGRFYHWLIVAATAGILTLIFDDKFYGIFFYIVVLLIVCCQLWLAVRAVYYKKRGAGIVATGFWGSIAGLAMGIYLQLNVSWSNAAFFETIPIAIGIFLLSPAFGISLFISREFALDSRLLAVKLAQVEQLSAANMAQEQEKQQLLADQNILLEQQVTERTAELNRSLTNLKATQTQLIQSEKMASLGELTAGIAHEIQNPLNFVNNFSEVSVELLEELKEEANAGNNDDVIAIAGDLTQNLDKIIHHGNRAAAIVKGMLQHSQSGGGAKELTDINKLADEYMRLSYHGFRAKDKSFNAEMHTHFDPKLPKITAIGQDIGRVMLNLFNNAFYAVNKKQKTAGEGYKAEVSVSTALEKGHVVVRVKDNGVGIPDAIKAKIMQPFFTTKPTGEGTGLGLSLTYDMVVKGHGGTIQVDSVVGEGSEFTITLPVS